MSDNWSRQELEASVVAYKEMLAKNEKGEKFTKTSYYQDLSNKYGRTPKAYEYRMQNISYVYDQLERPWLKGLKPLKNVGANVLDLIEQLVEIHDPVNFEPTKDSNPEKEKEITSKLVDHTDGVVSASSNVRSKKEIVTEQKEMELVKRYKKHLKQNNIGTFSKNQIRINLSDESTVLETDGWIHETKTLIEAKASSKRSDIRMAIGQLLDYKRHHNPQPENLAILLPAQPRQDLVDLIFSQNIEIIFENDSKFYHKKKDG